MDVEVYRIRRSGRYATRRIWRGVPTLLEHAQCERRLWTAPVIDAIMRQQHGRRIPCVLKRVFDGGAQPSGLRDLM